MSIKYQVLVNRNPQLVTRRHYQIMISHTYGTLWLWFHILTTDIESLRDKKQIHNPQLVTRDPFYSVNIGKSWRKIIRD